MRMLSPDMLLDNGQSKSVQVCGILRKAIVELGIQPGVAISEKEICLRLDISRTPVREAILQLASEHLVQITPRSGTRIAPINLQDVLDGHLVRGAIEIEVARQAAIKLTDAFDQRLEENIQRQAALTEAWDPAAFHYVDEEFHQLICECGASARVWKIVHNAKAQLDRVRRLSIGGPMHRLDVVLGEHTAILNGVRKRDPNLAGAAMRAHQRRAFAGIGLLITERREFFLPDPVAAMAEWNDMLAARFRTGVPEDDVDTGSAKGD